MNAGIDVSNATRALRDQLDNNFSVCDSSSLYGSKLSATNYFFMNFNLSLTTTAGVTNKSSNERSGQNHQGQNKRIQRHTQLHFTRSTHKSFVAKGAIKCAPTSVLKTALRPKDSSYGTRTPSWRSSRLSNFSCFVAM